ncbi:MAG: type II toxin-antitoxin system HicB family antitoxin [Lyngbya sp. HA4199-MV5]|jgi:predicted RNase H-like HicB family nuclease|nr:type II toxin-antitoxin system HicB family antitoxin [Lyngbya sp. HA4199-MV5]
MHNEFIAIIEAAAEGGYFAYCPEIVGANGQGETIEACRDDLAAAIALILDDRREDALRGIPEDAIHQIVSVG